MKKKGFTLIELIVVIAIIAALAAIMIPAMLGYVRRSKITNANAAAKSLLNAVNLAMTDMEAMDLPVENLPHTASKVSGATIYACKDYQAHGFTDDEGELKSIFYAKITHYFSDVVCIEQISYKLSAITCEGLGIIRGRFPGCNPEKITTEDYDNIVASQGRWDSDIALGFALDRDVVENE